MSLLKTQVTGMDVDVSDKRDLRWMVETHMTYYPPEKKKAVEIVVWIVGDTGWLLIVKFSVENFFKDKILKNWKKPI